MEPQERKAKFQRSLGIPKPPKLPDYPSYDASEEDNDPLTDDAASASSVPVSRAASAILNRQAHLKQNGKPARQHHLASSVLSDSDGVDSPTYDGDVESSTTIGTHPHHHRSSTISTMNTIPASHPEEPPVPTETQAVFDPAALTPEDIQAFVQTAIDGEEWRKYKINPPPIDRPVRVYADGVYDLFHFGHALQLRQAKLSFPETYLLAGVCSDSLVQEHKAKCVMNHAERCEAVRHCRWVDQVVGEAPWIIDAAFIEKYKIDYVAHDEDPYVAEGHEDVYSYVKSIGKFIPTRRTPGISTSELLERIVTGYRRRDFDKKLEKMGHAELKAEGSDYDSSRNTSRRGSHGENGS